MLHPRENYVIIGIYRILFDKIGKTKYRIGKERTQMAARITNIAPGSPAERAGLRQGDVIQSINGIEIVDYLDFMFASCQEEIEIDLEDRVVRIENQDYLPLGIQFATLLIDEPRACHNRCVFCFIDQLPKNMRESCYFKDDDYRLSFLQGNYVSMTNMTDSDVERILRYNLPRINVSVHTTNPELRVKMLHNKRAGEVLSYLKRFVDGGLNLNAQIVLCPGWNDGKELDRTISDLKVFRWCRLDYLPLVRNWRSFRALIRSLLKL